jgi:hypothetical protein
VKVYAIKSNCNLQVHPRILKGVHLSELTGKEGPLRPGNRKLEFFKPVNSKAFLIRLEKRENGLKFSLLNDQYTTRRLSKSPQWKEFDLEVFEFIDIVFKKCPAKKSLKTSWRCNLQGQRSEQSETFLLNGG